MNPPAASMRKSPWRRWWNLVKGFQRYRSLPRCTAEEAWTRLGACSICPSATPHWSAGLPTRLRGVLGIPLLVMCGPKLGEERPGVWCGCWIAAEDRRASPSAGPALGPATMLREAPISMTVKGRAVALEPAGKAVCAGEKCPRGLW